MKGKIIRVANPVTVNGITSIMCLIGILNSPSVVNRIVACQVYFIADKSGIKHPLIDILHRINLSKENDRVEFEVDEYKSQDEFLFIKSFKNLDYPSINRITNT